MELRSVRSFTISSGLCSSGSVPLVWFCAPRQANLQQIVEGSAEGSDVSHCFQTHSGTLNCVICGCVTSVGTMNTFTTLNKNVGLLCLEFMKIVSSIFNFLKTSAQRRGIIKRIIIKALLLLKFPRLEIITS